MAKAVKKVFLPSGLIASMYNLYCGDGKKKEALNLYDIQLICSYIEFYFNYTNPNSKQYIYRFYTLPHFYKANPTDKQDLKIEGKEKKIRNRHVCKVMDESVSDGGDLYKIHKSLTGKKEEAMNALLSSGKLPIEIDAELGKDKNLPKSAVEFGEILKRVGGVADLEQKDSSLGGFRMSEIYDIQRWLTRDSGDDSDMVSVPMINVGVKNELSTFFILNREKARGALTDAEFKEEQDYMYDFLQQFFASGCYKLLEADKKEQYAPNVDTFLDCFNKAVSAYKSLNFTQINSVYMPQLEKAKENRVDYEVAR